MAVTSWGNFEKLKERAVPSIVWASTGDAGTGKSYFGATGPGPIWVAAFDPWGMSRVDKTLIVGKEVRISRYPFDATKYKQQADVKKHATELWNRFSENYHEALKHTRTILWDREDMAYKLQRYSSFGGTSAAPKDYEDLTIEYVGMIQAANEHGVNLGLLRGLKSKWVSKWDAGKSKMVGHDTGEMIADGMKKAPDHVDVTLMHRWDPELKAYMTKIGKFTVPAERDMEYPNLTFPDMAMLAYPDSTVEDWQ